jgi:hypothetical protein
LWLVVIFMIAILIELRWHLSVVLICISFMAQMVYIFSFVVQPFGILLLKKFCLVQLPISLLVH